MAAYLILRSPSPDGGAGGPRAPQPDMSRRGFLKGIGVAAATAAVTGAIPVRAQDKPADEPVLNAAGAKVLGPGAVAVSFTLNGELLKTSVEPCVTLGSLIRYRLPADQALTGAKQACDRGACGSCTVLIDGQTVPSCTVLALDCDGRKVTTVEGLAPTGTDLHAVQKRFVEHDALQCGFCTPGMTVSCYALLTRNPNPTDAEVREATSGNICRCATYTRVVSATLAAAAELRGKPKEAPPVAGTPESLALAGKGGR
jgi:xanthine dehydrogenase YagT iron-sulfur-binding subunit